MHSHSELVRRSTQARRDFESGVISPRLLVSLFEVYSPGPGAEDIVRGALRQFPMFGCGVASVYLQHELQEGEVVDGAYINPHGRALPHTALVIESLVLVDITADQNGGPEVYVGPVESPWLFAKR